MANPKYKRILIKLSGEALAGERGVGIDIQTVQTIAKEIQEVHSLGIEIALVIGGGNLWRGEPAAEAGMDRVQADYTGMLGTVMNALVMADSLQQVGVDTRVQTAIAMQQVAEPYVRDTKTFVNNITVGQFFKLNGCLVFLRIGIVNTVDTIFSHKDGICFDFSCTKSRCCIC